MSLSTPIRLTVLALMLFALTFATFRVVNGRPNHSVSSGDSQMVMGEITVPVEIIEAGESPATVEVRVQP